METDEEIYKVVVEATEFAWGIPSPLSAVARHSGRGLLEPLPEHSQVRGHE